MLNWIAKLLQPTRGELDLTPEQQALLRELRNELVGLEKLFIDCTTQCIHQVPQELDTTPERFRELMLDLHRGLVIKTFVQIAHADRRWTTAERVFGLAVIQHVWSTAPTGQALVHTLQAMADHAEALSWSGLLGPFVRYSVFEAQVARLHAYITRIANLTAKADGRVTEAEENSLRAIQIALGDVFRPRPVDRYSPVPPPPPRQLIPPTNQARQQQQQVIAPPVTNAVNNELPPQRELRTVLAELDGLIGLKSIKREIRRLIDFLKIQTERSKHQLPPTSISLHTVFTGNPGTGKTTVARLLGEILSGLQILRRGQTIETDRSGMVAEYAGQTGPKVNELINRALDGVLFVDEAYSLVAESGDDPYGAEAVQTLLKRMEDDRDRLVVVLAGYPDPMAALLATNPGLSSRFQRTLHFPDYTETELLQIFEKLCTEHHYVVRPQTRTILRQLFQQMLTDCDKNFGNGRVVRNLFEDAIQHLAGRIIKLAPITKELLTHLEPEDIVLRSATWQ